MEIFFFCVLYLVFIFGFIYIMEIVLKISFVTNNKSKSSKKRCFGYHRLISDLTIIKQHFTMPIVKLFELRNVYYIGF